VSLVWNAPRADTIYELRKNPLRALYEFIQYIVFSRGLFLLPLVQVMILARSVLLDDKSVTHGTAKDFDGRDPENLPDIEIMPCPTGATHRKTQDAFYKGAVSFICVVLRPHSRGDVTLVNLDPRARPRCRFNAMQDSRDMVTMKKAVRLGLALGAHAKNSGYALGEPIFGTTGTEEDVERHIQENLMSTFHYASSCRMAPLAEGGVVDDQLRVHGIRGLRIADASIFPVVPACHLQAPTVMIGERCAEFIKETCATDK
jgi:choline dehydrogenase